MQVRTPEPSAVAAKRRQPVLQRAGIAEPRAQQVELQQPGELLQGGRSVAGTQRLPHTGAETWGQVGLEAQQPVGPEGVGGEGKSSDSHTDLDAVANSGDIAGDLTDERRGAVDEKDALHSVVILDQGLDEDRRQWISHEGGVAGHDDGAVDGLYDLAVVDLELVGS